MGERESDAVLEARIDALAERVSENTEMLAELQAAGVVDQAHIGHLEAALRSSRTIGAAIGLIMARFGVDEDTGFQVLRKRSQDQNRKVRELAAEIVASGSLDVVMMNAPSAHGPEPSSSRPPAS